MLRFTIPSFVLVFAVVLLTASFSLADQASDVARGPVDPYEPGYERSKFLAAAGVDSELDEQEFAANQKADKPFVRTFDSWAVLKTFDANRSGTMDWFEVDKYRRAIRAAVLGQFDKDKNNRLTAAERDDANKLLAAGRTPKLALPNTGGTPNTGNTGRTQNPQGSQGYSRIEWDKDGDGKFSDEERKAYYQEIKERNEKIQAEYVRKYDKDGNGKVDGDEWNVANEERMRDWREKNPEAAAKYDKQMETYKRQQAERIEKYDENDNGKIDGNEWKAIQADNMKAWKEKNPEAYTAHMKRQQDYIDKHDKDGDGELSTEERNAAYAAQREEYKKRQEEYVRQHDKDGDGKLSREESEAARKAWYDDWKEKNPEAAKRYEENRKKWDERRKDGQNGQNGQGGVNYRVTPMQGGAGFGGQGIVGGVGGPIVFPAGQGVAGSRVIQINPIADDDEKN